MIVEAPKRVERLLEKSGRITPREVLGAYDETGLKPLLGAFYDGRGACAVGVVAAQRGFPSTYPITELTHRGYNREYVWGVVAGFENAPRDSKTTPSVEMQGWRDGKRARRAIESRYGRLSHD